MLLVSECEVYVKMRGVRCKALCVTVAPGFPLLPLNPGSPAGPLFPEAPSGPGSPWKPHIRDHV